MAVDLTALGLTPLTPGPDAILLAQIDRWSDLRQFVTADFSRLGEIRKELLEYQALTEKIADTAAVTPAGVTAKLNAALVTMGATTGPTSYGTVWLLPIRAIQDALRVGV